MAAVIALPPRGDLLAIRVGIPAQRCLNPANLTDYEPTLLCHPVASRVKNCRPSTGKQRTFGNFCFIIHKFTRALNYNWEYKPFDVAQYLKFLILIPFFYTRNMSVCVCALLRVYKIKISIYQNSGDNTTLF